MNLATPQSSRKRRNRRIFSEIKLKDGEGNISNQNITKKPGKGVNSFSESNEKILNQAEKSFEQKTSKQERSVSLFPKSEKGKREEEKLKKYFEEVDNYELKTEKKQLGRFMIQDNTEFFWENQDDE